MSTVTTRFRGVPSSAVREFESVALRTGHKVADAVNWCLLVMVTPPEQAQLFWVPDAHKDQPERVTIQPPAMENLRRYHAELPLKTLLALVPSAERAGGYEVVFARASSLAQYFGRKDGVMAYSKSGRVGRGCLRHFARF